MTTAVSRPIVTLADLTLRSFEHGAVYKGRDAPFAAMLGLKGLGIRYNEVPAGKSMCPFHNHHVEDELFIVLEGEGTYRFGADSFSFKAGDVLGAPAGGHETAHQIINTGGSTLRYLGLSTVAATEVCEYPDSGKFQVNSLAASGQPAVHPYLAEGFQLRQNGRVGEHNLYYWDGEPGAKVPATVESGDE